MVVQFSQNSDLLAELERTGSNQLVECAPRDTRWGIGLGYNNPAAADRARWRGSNWLGECLTAARQ